MKRTTDSAKWHPILLFICFILVFFVFFLFLTPYINLNPESDALISDHLEAYTSILRRQANHIIHEAQNTLIHITAMIDDLSPDDAWLYTYLEKLNTKNHQYLIHYITTRQLQEGVTSEKAQEHQIYTKLIAGQSVVSEISDSKQLHTIIVAEPVSKNGQLTGALCAKLNASLLTEMIPESILLQKANALIVKENGEIAYSNGFYKMDGNLFDFMEQNKIPFNTIQTVLRLFQENDTISYQFESKGNKYCISAEALGYNDWYIAIFTQSPNTLLHVSSHLESILWIGIVLVLLPTLFGLIIMILLLQQKQRLNREQERYAALSQFSDTVLFEYDYQTDTLEFTPNARERLLHRDLTLKHISNDLPNWGLLHPDDLAVMQRIFDCPPDCGPEHVCYTEARLKDQNGIYCWFGCQCKYLFTASGEPCRVIGKLVDITDQRGREQILLEQAQKDILTQTYNKSGEQLINQLLKTEPLGLFFMLDLDNFKKINDTYGHTAGDSLLAQVGILLNRAFRSEDIVVRVGGDEFVIFLPHSSDPELAKQKARSILNQIRSIQIVPACPHPVTASIGIAICPKDGTTYADLYIAADQAMYAIKQTSKGGFAFHS